MIIQTINSISVNTIAEYNNFKDQGYEPLASLIFNVDFNLRLELQKELFGFPSPSNDNKYYKYIFETKPNICEETDKPLIYNAACVSHILTKGANPIMRYDLRNNNLLWPVIHNIWEYGLAENKRELKIYYKNQLTIKLLKKEYHELKS